MKKILKAVLALVVILIALVLLHPVWIGPVVRTAVARLAPKYLGVTAKLDGFSLNAYTGRVAIDGFVLDNPPGCKAQQFVAIGHLRLDVNPTTVLSDPIVIEEITVRDLYVSIVSDAEKVYNYMTIAETCSPDDAPRKSPAANPSPQPDDRPKPSPKVIVDFIHVQNALVQWERVPLSLPSFKLTGIGRGVGGVEFKDAWKEMLTQFVGALGPLAKELQILLAGSQGTLDAGKKSVSDVAQAVNDTKNALSNVRKALKDGTSASADAAQSSIDAAAKSVKGTVDTLKSLFK